MDDFILLRLKELMKDSGLNQTRFASRIGMRQQNLSRILTGKSSLGDGIVNKLIISFDVNREWLLTGNGDKYPPKPVASDNPTTESLLSIIAEKDRQIDRLLTLLEKK